jgi:predicted aspartyl protease
MAVVRVESERFPYLPLTLTLGEYAAVVEALLDTGFDGDVVIPLSLITVGKPPDEYRQWALADGSIVVTPVYYGTV